VADIQTPRPALKSSEHEVANMLVVSLFYCSRKKKWQRAVRGIGLWWYQHDRCWVCEEDFGGCSSSSLPGFPM